MYYISIIWSTLNVFFFFSSYVYSWYWFFFSVIIWMLGCCFYLRDWCNASCRRKFLLKVLHPLMRLKLKALSWFRVRRKIVLLGNHWISWKKQALYEHLIPRYLDFVCTVLACFLVIFISWSGIVSTSPENNLILSCVTKIHNWKWGWLMIIYTLLP